MRLNDFWFRLARSAEGEGGGAGGGAGAEGVGTAAGEGGAPQDAPPASLLSGDDTQAGGQDTIAGGQDTQPGGEAPAAFDSAAVTLPEGFSVPEGTMTAFSGILTDAALTPQERGQKLLDLYATNLQAQATAANEANAAAWQKMNDEWRTAAMALPEFAGKAEAEIGAVKQGLLAAGATPDFFKALDLTGAGNNPHVLQVLHKLTLPYREGKPIGGGANRPVTAADRAAKMYPTMKTQE
jgi:hypothetical protein